jgi:hypothetical protein
MLYRGQAVNIQHSFNTEYTDLLFDLITTLPTGHNGHNSSRNNEYTLNIDLFY